MPVDYKVEVARQLCNALGYAHSRGVVHGRLSAHNVFLESRVQLSLIDYAAGAANPAYSSPQVLQRRKMAPHHQQQQMAPRNYRVGTDPSDDAFAFGTVLFETFAGKAPFADESDDGEVAARILSGRLPDAIQELDLTTVIICLEQFELWTPINQYELQVYL